MEQIKRSALVNYSSQQMYQLVDDIENYSQFLPYCSYSTTIERKQDEVLATLEVAKSGMAKSFSTKNTLKPFESIKITLLNGPFKYLNGEWRFTALSSAACKIELDLEFEFSNKLASIAFTRIFKKLTQSMVAAFVERAQTIYD